MALADGATSSFNWQGRDLGIWGIINLPPIFAFQLVLLTRSEAPALIPTGGRRRRLLLRSIHSILQLRTLRRSELSCFNGPYATCGGYRVVFQRSMTGAFGRRMFQRALWAYDYGGGFVLQRSSC